MKIIVTYDIIKNKIRGEIADILFFYGLLRVQNSVFFGDIKKRKIKNLVKRIKSIELEEEDSIYIFKVCEKDFKNINFFGKSINLYYIEEYFIFIW